MVAVAVPSGGAFSEVAGAGPAPVQLEGRPPCRLRPERSRSLHKNLSKLRVAGLTNQPVVGFNSGAFRTHPGPREGLSPPHIIPLQLTFMLPDCGSWA